MILARASVPFVIGLADSEAQRAAYRAALVAGHSRGGDARALGALVLLSVEKQNGDGQRWMVY